jgi:uncharacterized phage-associated protein
MVSVFDVAAFILDKKDSMPAMKLQKRVYYCQAWSLVWDEQALFEEPIEAWANGPVVRKLYDAHRGKFRVTQSDIQGNPSRLSETQCETIQAILRDYGNKSSQWLSDLTHSEHPWQEARKGLSPGVRGNKVISLASMAEYYEAVSSDGLDIEN